MGLQACLLSPGVFISRNVLIGLRQMRCRALPCCLARRLCFFRRMSSPSFVTLRPRNRRPSIKYNWLYGLFHRLQPNSLRHRVGHIGSTVSPIEIKSMQRCSIKRRARYSMAVSKASAAFRKTLLGDRSSKVREISEVAAELLMIPLPPWGWRKRCAERAWTSHKSQRKRRRGSPLAATAHRLKRSFRIPCEIQIGIFDRRQGAKDRLFTLSAGSGPRQTILRFIVACAHADPLRAAVCYGDHVVKTSD